MEKNAYNPNYPHMPPQMTSNPMDSDKMQTMAPAPPSYDQATGSGVQQATSYPPVQVLSTPQTGNANNFAQQQQQQQQQPSYPTYPSHQHNPPMSNLGQTTTYQTVQPMVQPMVQQPMFIIQQQAILPLGPEATYITCPACHIQKLTRIEYEPSSRTHLMAALLCILGLWCCVCLPYCAGSCMNANHYCGNCNKFLGTYGNGL